MAYIGRGTENISNVEVLDNLTFNGSASYTLQKSSTNFVPSSANNLLISISGVVQQGNFSVSGSTITFDTTVSASDTCDWILHYGTGLITTVADGAITEAKLGSNAVTTAKINNGAITSAKLDSGLALGKIGQVVWGRTETALTTSSTTYSDLLSLNITPSATSSKILLMGTVPIRKTDPSPPTDNGAGLRFEKDGTALEEWGRYIAWDNNTQVYIQQTGAMNYLDSPSTTSQINYKLQVRSMVGGSIQACHDTSNASFTLMEVLA